VTIVLPINPSNLRSMYALVDIDSTSLAVRFNEGGGSRTGIPKMELLLDIGLPRSK
jgi:hypothetical protein